jgi:peptide/nickel transport system substrate-binding protein
VNYYNNLFTFGTKIGNPSGDEVLGAPNYKNVFVMP